MKAKIIALDNAISKFEFLKNLLYDLSLLNKPVVMLIRTLFLNLGKVKDLKRLMIFVLNFSLFYSKMIQKLMVRPWGQFMHLLEKETINDEMSSLKTNKN